MQKWRCDYNNKIKSKQENPKLDFGRGMRWKKKSILNASWMKTPLEADKLQKI